MFGLMRCSTTARRSIRPSGRYWPADVHLIAKDILWFHAVIWPAMLMALDLELPKQVYAHSFWISEGQKMSKSLGNFIDLERIDRYVATFGLDALRYVLATTGPLGTTDSDFTDAKFIEVYNSDLANTLGNCLSRVTNMTARYFEGKLPPLGPPVASQIDCEARSKECIAKYKSAMGQWRLDQAVGAALDLVRAVDGYIEETGPFKLAKDAEKKPQVGTILFQCAEAIRVASILLWPAMPGKIEQLWQQIGCEDYTETLASRGQGQLEKWVVWGLLESGTQVTKGEALFPRYQGK